MARGKSPENPNVPLHPDANEALERLREQLPKWGVPKETRKQEVASAVLYYTPPLIAAAMTGEYLRHLERQAEAARAAEDQDDDG